MTLLEIAQIYTDLVNAESEIPDNEYCAKDRLNALRSKYHDILMEQMRTEGIDYADRFDATRKAFELINNSEKYVLTHIRNSNVF